MSTDLDFDMEWAYYCLTDDDEKKPGEDAKGEANPIVNPMNPMNLELAVASEQVRLNLPQGAQGWL